MDNTILEINKEDENYNLLKCFLAQNQYATFLYNLANWSKNHDFSVNTSAV